MIGNPKGVLIHRLRTAAQVNSAQKLIYTEVTAGVWGRGARTNAKNQGLDPA